MRALRLVPWVAGAALGMAAEASLYGRGDAADWASDLAVGWSLIACGLLASTWRPESRSGSLMAATGFTWFAGNFWTSDIGWISWLSAHALYLYRGPLVHLLLTYPRGRCTSRLEKAAVGLGYAAAVVAPVWRSLSITVAVSAALAAVCTREYLGALGPERRERLAAWQATVFTAVALAGTALARLTWPGMGTRQATLVVLQIVLTVLAVALLTGLLAQPWRRPLADIVVELGEERSRSLSVALAQALGDPTLTVGYWSPGTPGYVDEAGSPLELSGPDSRRRVTYVDRGGEPAAVLIHDCAVLDDPALLEEVATAVWLAGEHARLRARARGQVAEIDASRLRLLRAERAERGRLEHRVRETAERRLHRIEGLLESARRSAEGTGVSETIARAAALAGRTAGELQELARGLRPVGGTRGGLVVSLRELAEQCPVPVELALAEDPLPEEVEATIYFVCSEALANVAKYAAASRARLTLSVAGGRAGVEIGDDGVGGASLAAGSGLRGLADRVEALGGTFLLESPPGRGTCVTAYVPLRP